MKKILGIVIFFFSAFNLFPDQATTNVAPIEQSPPEVIYNGPSDNLLMPGLGYGSLLLFPDPSSSLLNDVEGDIYFIASLNHRVQFGDSAALDTTVDYHFLLMQDGYGTSMSSIFDPYLTVSPVFLFHFYHDSYTRKMPGYQAFVANTTFQLFGKPKQEILAPYDVETLATSSIRLGTAFRIGIEGIQPVPYKNLLIGWEYRALSQASYRASNGTELTFNDLFSISLDAVINYPAAGTYQVIDCIGFDLGTKIKIFGANWDFDFGYLNYVDSRTGGLIHGFVWDTLLEIPFRL